MKAATTILFGFFLSLAAISAEPKAPISVDPTLYLGKTFEDCEKTLGKPVEIRTMSKDKMVFVRIYALNSQYFDYVELVSDAILFGGKLPPNVVTGISYGFKKLPECEFLKCYKKPNHNAVSLKEIYTFFGFKDFDKAFGSLPQGIETILHPAFGYITPDGGSLAGFRMLVPIKSGDVQAEFWSIQWLEDEDKQKLAGAEKLRSASDGSERADAITAYVKSHQPREKAEFRFYLRRLER